MSKVIEKIINGLQEPTWKVTPIDARKVAEMIADDLFTTERGDKAVRLSMILLGRRDGGSWCKSAATDRIEAILKRVVAG